MTNGGTPSSGGAGPLVESGSKVVLVVSRGPGEAARAGAVAAPDVAGKAQGDALSHLQGAGLNAQIVNDYSPSVKRGHVIDQFPKAGQMQAINSEIVLLVSSGPATATARTALPDVVGLTEEAAVGRVGTAGLTAEVVHQNHPNVAAGIVFAQLPSQSSVSSAGKKGGPGPWVWIAVAVVTVALLAFGVFAFAGMGKRAPVTVPSVVGMTQEKAQETLIAAGLKVGSVESTPTKTAEVGTVVSQTPAAGASVKSGGAVQLAVAAKPAQVTVPDVVGTSAASADADLRKLDLVPAEKSDYSATVAKGYVISQNPAAGEKVESGSKVNMTVSKGPQVTNTVTVPDLVGMTQAAAVEKTNALGLSSKLTSDYDSSVPTGSVALQSPDAGVSVAAGSTVKLTVSLGPTP